SPLSRATRPPIMPDPATPNGPAVHRSLLPPGWPRPKGYANGIEAEGRLIFVGGQIGWDEHGRLVSDDFVEQTRQALHNVIAILAEAGAAAEHVTRMTWYVTDLAAYRERQRDLG